MDLSFQENPIFGSRAKTQKTSLIFIFLYVQAGLVFEMPVGKEASKEINTMKHQLEFQEK